MSPIELSWTAKKPYLYLASIIMAGAILKYIRWEGEEGCKRLLGWFGVLFCPCPNGQFLVLRGGVRTLARIFYALLAMIFNGTQSMI